ncbi:MAG: hypothetical protein ACK5O1_03800 [Holosporales bacterium]|jgi:hypothetical protein
MKKLMLVALLAAFAASPVVAGQAFANEHQKKEHHGKTKHKKHEKPADAAPAQGQ